MTAVTTEGPAGAGRPTGRRADQPPLRWGRVLTVARTDLRQLAQDAIDRGADVLGMAGGDGSQALVASVAMDAGVAMVCIPAGTRNHFALDLGLDREDVVGALDAYADAVERRIDLARVELGTRERVEGGHDPGVPGVGGVAGSQLLGQFPDVPGTDVPRPRRARYGRRHGR